MKKTANDERKKILRGVDEEIGNLSQKDKKKFMETYDIVISDDPWLSQRGLSDRTNPQVVKKVLYNEMFNKDFSLLDRYKHKN